MADAFLLVAFLRLLYVLLDIVIDFLANQIQLLQELILCCSGSFRLQNVDHYPSLLEIQLLPVSNVRPQDLFFRYLQHIVLQLELEKVLELVYDFLLFLFRHLCITRNNFFILIIIFFIQLFFQFLLLVFFYNYILDVIGVIYSSFERGILSPEEFKRHLGQLGLLRQFFLLLFYFLIIGLSLLLDVLVFQKFAVLLLYLFSLINNRKKARHRQLDLEQLPVLNGLFVHFFF